MTSKLGPKLDFMFDTTREEDLDVMSPSIVTNQHVRVPRANLSDEHAQQCSFVSHLSELRHPCLNLSIKVPWKLCHSLVSGSLLMNWTNQ
mmetsp:Transcript_9483/g.27220  ORF Transcript_9483/g.27220 Transcript_9483/m.27220 type:complete len:90 (+) Transcript_9483:351-620(+)